MTFDLRLLVETAATSARPSTAPESEGIRPLKTSSSSPTQSHDDAHHNEEEEFRAMAVQATQRQVKQETKGFGFHSCALQIKDQRRSKWFYTQVLGMDIVKETESHGVTMIFLAFPNPIDVETPGLEFGQRRGLLQLIHVAGDEDGDSFQIRHGHPGFCHLCMNVPDLDSVLARMQTMGVSIVEPACEQGYAVIADPDAYNIQLLSCEIDQSLALKRQLEKMIKSSLAESFSIAGNGGDDDLAQLCDSSLSGIPALNSFRGGSPDLEHPHWSGVFPGGGSALSFASPVDVQHSAPPVETTMHKTTTESYRLRPATAAPLTTIGFAKLQASTSASASSTAYSNGSTRDRSSFASSATKATTGGVKGVSSASSVKRNNAPRSIDLTSLKGRPGLVSRRKTMSPNSLGVVAGASSISSYFKITHSDVRGSKVAQSSHRSLPASPGEVPGKLLAADEAGDTHHSHRPEHTDAAQSKRLGTSSLRSLRDRLAFHRNSRQR